MVMGMVMAAVMELVLRGCFEGFEAFGRAFPAPPCTTPLRPHPHACACLYYTSTSTSATRQTAHLDDERVVLDAPRLQGLQHLARRKDGAAAGRGVAPQRAVEVHRLVVAVMGRR